MHPLYKTPIATLFPILKMCMPDYTPAHVILEEAEEHVSGRRNTSILEESNITEQDEDDEERKGGPASLEPIVMEFQIDDVDQGDEPRLKIDTNNLVVDTPKRDVFSNRVEGRQKLYQSQQQPHT